MTAPTLPDDVREKVREAITPIVMWSRGGWKDDVIDAFLLALSEAGYVVVPREPSEAMLMSIREGMGVRQIYRALIAASEKP